MVYITDKEIKQLEEILDKKNNVSFPFEDKYGFDLWFDSWIGFPIKQILENNIQRRMRVMK